MEYRVKDYLHSFLLDKQKDAQYLTFKSSNTQVQVPLYHGQSKTFKLSMMTCNLIPTMEFCQCFISLKPKTLVARSTGSSSLLAVAEKKK